MTRTFQGVLLKFKDFSRVCMCAFNHQRSNVQIPCIADASRPILTDQEVSIEANFNNQWFDGRQIRFKGGKKCNIRCFDIHRFACKTRCTFLLPVLPYLSIMEKRLPFSPLSPGGPTSPLAPQEGSPFIPMSPLGPISPGGPAGPISPGGPAGPISPGSPLSPGQDNE